MTGPIYFEHFAHRPLPWPEHRGRWVWAITDGMAGRAIASGTALTRRGAVRKQEAAYGRCEQRAPYTQEPLRPLTEEEACLICALLQAKGVPVEVSLCGTAVVVRQIQRLTTEQEVRVLNAVLDSTDAPFRWAGVA
ncbi:hypothetical protein Ait01nite_089840 [Actinoplanes italicus]|uniref:Uncharacterized protein n=1 Tax=Actinoplanes italicus TaxID=113567 RepID=A0A2T0JIL2_9ACTN|nr:hypothetical protein [Actinoplanes italicus]PRX07401.1 hypothetical protein CLV67_14276 [Actinoplanes italicus]GIE35939.1 hypothetical protein Ait01nite_089840 [Actinoplanes italicus]